MPIYSDSPINVGKTYNAYNVSAADSIDSGWTLAGSGTNGVVSISSAYDLGTSGDSVGSGKYAIILTDGTLKFNDQIPAGTRITVSFWSGNADGYTGYSNIGDGHDLRLRDSSNGSSSWGSVSGAKWMKCTEGLPASRNHVNLTSSTGTIDHSEIPNDADMAFFSVTFESTAAMYYRIEGLSDNNTSNTKMLYDLKLTTGGNLITNDGDTTIQPWGHVNLTSFSIDGSDIEATATELNYLAGQSAGSVQPGKVVTSNSDYQIDLNQVGFKVHGGLMVSGSSNVSVNNANKFIRLIELEPKIGSYGGISNSKSTSHAQILVNFTGNEGDSTTGNFTLLINAKFTGHSTLNSGQWQSPYYDSDGTTITCAIIGSDPGFNPATDLKMNISRHNTLYLYAGVYVKTPFAYRDVVVTHLVGGAKGYLRDEDSASDSYWFTSKDQSYVASVPEPFNAGSFVNVATISGGWEGLVAGKLDVPDMGGMILSYVALYNDTQQTDVLDGTYTAIASADQSAVITFVAPKSGNIELHFSCFVYTNEYAWIYLSYDTDASYSATAGREILVLQTDESDDNIVYGNWVITGLTPGTSYTYHIYAKENGNASNAATLKWGGNSTGDTDGTGSNQPLIIKVTSLPSTIVQDN